MNKKTAPLLVASILLAACATGGRGNRIREIRAEDAIDCKYLGAVEAADRSGWTMADDQLGAMPQIRRLVSEKGGNAFVVTHGAGVKYAPAIKADVYRCR